MVTNIGFQSFLNTIKVPMHLKKKILWTWQRLSHATLSHLNIHPNFNLHEKPFVLFNKNSLCKWAKKGFYKPRKFSRAIYGLPITNKMHLGKLASPILGWKLVYEK